MLNTKKAKRNPKANKVVQKVRFKVIFSYYFVVCKIFNKNFIQNLKTAGKIQPIKKKQYKTFRFINNR